VMEELLIFADDGHQRVWDSWKRWVLLVSSGMLLELHSIYWHLVPFYRVWTWQWHLSQCLSYTRFTDKGLVMTVEFKDIGTVLLFADLPSMSCDWHSTLSGALSSIWSYMNFSHLFYYLSFWWNCYLFGIYKLWLLLNKWQTTLF
jgi:hypothetical protein